MANTGHDAVSVGTTVTLILTAESCRKGVVIQNLSDKDLFVGFDTSITTVNTICIGPGQPWSMGGHMEGYRGSIYGIVATGAADVRYQWWGQ